MIDQEIKDLMISDQEWNSMLQEDEIIDDSVRYGDCSWVLGISTAGHGGSICLMRDQQIVFFLKEERVSRLKRDHKYPFHAIQEVKKYTNTLCLVIFLNLSSTERDEFLNQLEKENFEVKDWVDPMELDQTWKYLYGSSHHINHASCGYHLSPFKEATTIVMDGWGWVGRAMDIVSDVDAVERYGSENNELRFGVRVYEHVSIFKSGAHFDEWELLYKEISSDWTRNVNLEGCYPSLQCVEEDYKDWYETISGCEDTEIHLVQPISVPVCYESVTCFLGFHQEDVGKTMGLSCYGKPNDEIPSFIHKDNELKEVSDVVSNCILLNANLYPQLKKYDKENDSSFQQRADMAYRIQKDLEEKVICVVEKAMKMNDCKNIVLSGGVFHNVMINELLTSKYPDYNFFADPICDDAGHSYGGAIWFLKALSKKDFNIRPKSMYLGPSYWKEEIRERVINAVNKYNCPVL